MPTTHTYLVPIAIAFAAAAAFAQGTAGGGAQGAQGQGAQGAAQGAQSAQHAAPTPATRQTPPPPATQPTPAQPSTAAQSTVQPDASQAAAQQTVQPNTPNAAGRSRDTSRTRQAVVSPATATDATLPAARDVGATDNKPDCSRMRGIGKGECERRDTSRDDLPSGETTTQPEKQF